MSKRTRVAVIGSEGYLGTEVCKLLADEPRVDLIRVDAGFWGQTMDPGVLRLDMTNEADRAQVVDLVPDVVVYLAALAHDPEKKFSYNQHYCHTCEAPLDLIGSLPRTCRVVVMSSLSVLSNDGSYYGLAKRDLERELIEVMYDGRCITIIRSGTLFGASSDPRRWRRHLLLNSMVRSAEKNGVIEVHGDGEQTRSIAHVGGLACEVSASIFDRSPSLRSFSTGCLSICRAAEMVQKHTASEIRYTGRPNPDNRSYVTGYRVTGKELSHIVQSLVSWYRRHRDEVEAVNPIQEIPL